MELSELLKELKEEPKMEKTAAVKTSKSNDKTQLLSALDDAINSLEKTAESKEKDVTPELLKMAEDLANSEAVGLQKEAEFYGAALADGFLTRLNQYATALAATGFNKTAADDAWQEAFNAGLMSGYQDGLVGIPKIVQGVPPVLGHDQEKVAEFIQGYNDAAELLQSPEGQEKVAEFIQGYNDAATLLQSPEGQEKVAEFIQGYNDAAELLQTPEGQKKIAEFIQGYNDAAELLQTPGGQEKIAEFLQGFADGTALLEKLASAVTQTAYKQTLNLVRKAVGKK